MENELHQDGLPRLLAQVDFIVEIARDLSGLGIETDPARNIERVTDEHPEGNGESGGLPGGSMERRSECV